MVSVGALIWVSCRPLLKMAICTGAGFILSRRDLFSSVAARGAGQVLLNITIPALMFSKIVPAFNSQNVAALGPLITMGIIYQLIGLAIALIAREMFWVPHRFRSGIIVAGVWSNYGDIPTAVIMSITAGAPFTPDDVNLGVAYISAFILVFTISLFPLGGHTLIAKDFEGPNKEDEEVRDALRGRHRRLAAFIQRHFKISRARREEDIEETGSTPSAKGDPSDTTVTATIPQVVEENSRQRNLHTHVTFDGLPHLQLVNRSVHERKHTDPEIRSPSPSAYGMDTMSPTTTVAPTEKEFNKEDAEKYQDDNLDTSSASITSFSQSRALRSRLFKFIQTLLAPATIAILLGLLISLVRPLKGLFVPIDNSPIPNAPDGNPPLYFIYDATNFLGAASVPLGLVCLGAALAKMKVPKDLKKLPLGAISCLAVGKLVISPLLGVLIVDAFVKVGFIPEGDKVLRFVTIFFSCMPTSTTQVFLTQVYSGTGEAEHLSAFLIPQYALMLVSMTALTAYSLHLLH